MALPATPAATGAPPPWYTAIWASLAFYLRGGLRGYDFFISYSRADATAYALALAERLGEKNLTCYIDQWGALPGAEVPAPLLQKLRRSQVLLVVGSAQALHSAAVQQEITVFAETGRPIVPIAFGSMQQAVWSQRVLGLAVTVETAEALAKAQPSEAVVARASGSLTYARQDRRIKRAIWGTTGLFVVLGMATVLTLTSAKRQLADLNLAFTQTNQRLATAVQRKQQADAALASTQAAKEAATAQLIATRKETNSIRVSLSQAQDALAGSLRSLALERERVRTEQAKLVVARADAQSKLETLNKQVASATELVKHLEKGLGELYHQPSLEHCGLDGVTAEQPLSVYMYMNRASLTNIEPATLMALNKLVDCLKANPEYNVMVVGHLAEYIWSAEYNEDGIYTMFKASAEYKYLLGISLARVISDFLEDKGIAKSRITFKSYGDRWPRYKLSFMNNRVEISVAKVAAR